MPLLEFASMFLSMTAKDEHEGNLLNELHPLATLLSFPVTKLDPDTMILDWDLRDLDTAEFIEAIEKEVADHVECGHGEVVLISMVPKGNKLILAIWSIKCK